MAVKAMMRCFECLRTLSIRVDGWGLCGECVGLYGHGADPGAAFEPRRRSRPVPGTNLMPFNPETGEFEEAA